MEKTNVYPSRGWVLVEIVEAESRVALPDSAKGESMYGRILEIGKPGIGEGGVIQNIPSFIVDSNKESLGGKDYKLKKGDIILFKKMTQHGITSYDTNVETAFVNFESILGVKLTDK